MTDKHAIPSCCTTNTKHTSQDNVCTVQDSARQPGLDPITQNHFNYINYNYEQQKLQLCIVIKFVNQNVANTE